MRVKYYAFVVIATASAVLENNKRQLGFHCSEYIRASGRYSMQDYDGVVETKINCVMDFLFIPHKHFTHTVAWILSIFGVLFIELSLPE